LTSSSSRDPYELRARELALAAGVDPDSRIERPGHRSMPAWCVYRDAARKEQLAQETASVAESLASSGVAAAQPEQYRDSSLKVFGAHDDNTIAQMRNCMSVGNVVGGVICADGHLGYAQPVGGVIAYEGQISIFGVGFAIGCGNMAVRLDTPFAAIEDRVGAIIRDVASVISSVRSAPHDARVAGCASTACPATPALASEAIGQVGQGQAGAQLGEGQPRRRGPCSASGRESGLHAGSRCRRMGGPLSRLQCLARRAARPAARYGPRRSNPGRGHHGGNRGVRCGGINVSCGKPAAGCGAWRVAAVIRRRNLGVRRRYLGRGGGVLSGLCVFFMGSQADF
jgi:hypothetical protein